VPVAVQDLGVGWVILGHSERRALIKESSDLIADKTGVSPRTIKAARLL